MKKQTLLHHGVMGRKCLLTFSYIALQIVMCKNQRCKIEKSFYDLPCVDWLFGSKLIAEHEKRGMDAIFIVSSRTALFFDGEHKVLFNSRMANDLNQW